MKRTMMDVITFWMEGEIENLIKVWTTAVLSLSYCYFLAKIAPKGATRLVAFLPAMALFVFVPLTLHTVFFTAITAFFFTWLTNFKLLSLAFDKGPLYTSYSLPKFLVLACLPIKFKTQEKYDQHRPKSFWNFAIKVLGLVLIVIGYGYADILHPNLLRVMFGWNVYLSCEILVTVAAALARGLLGTELEQQFDEPYMASSLQDFWGRRWNLAVARMLHPTVYLPVREVLGPLAGVMASFTVSGLMHELIFYYMIRVRPTWEVTCFFVVNGVCMTAEIAVKRTVKDRWRLPRAVGTILTVGFVTVTGCWLFLPQFERGKVIEKGVVEATAVGAFVKDFLGVLLNNVNA